MEAIKYTVKPQELIETKGKAKDIIAAMTGLRLFRGFGNCAKLKLTRDDEHKESCPCSVCGEHGTMRPAILVEEMEIRRSRKR
jgi:hypothetical protein